MTEEDQRSVWIRTVPAAHGTYRPALEIDDDTAHDLGGGVAWKHAHAVLAAAARAEHDAAVIRQMTGIKNEAAVLVQQMRAERQPIDWPTPLTLDPGVSAATGNPFLAVRVKGKVVGQWTVADARDHALGALEADEAADLDGAYLRALLACDVGEAMARAVIGDLANHRAEPESPDDRSPDGCARHPGVPPAGHRPVRRRARRSEPPMSDHACPHDCQHLTGQAWHDLHSSAAPAVPEPARVELDAVRGRLAEVRGTRPSFLTRLPGEPTGHVVVKTGSEIPESIRDHAMYHHGPGVMRHAGLGIWVIVLDEIDPRPTAAR